MLTWSLCPAGWFELEEPWIRTIPDGCRTWTSWSTCGLVCFSEELMSQFVHFDYVEIKGEKKLQMNV